ncbi:TIGR00730 family Rossman fold protein [Schlegelella sp. S2-27]|uniref:Cytokinin riboside 5'-monophosphate phosphoribohydrolase n=1 Tax=Caldimonas mangrovi TaxID=2944811 RepID=A0ABT0YPG8_9BURK|nr:TIGR00730 family Rossman fold protein [Caldimonas mangrovi]MCM5679773.1 TIGR00730 family Rossman fold protein [Caldimonas mangrovi]
MAVFSVCVYCGSRLGASPAYEQIAWEAGTLIGRMGWQLVYGGGRAGLMGCIADATLAAGGTAIGVIPQALLDRELGHRGLTELHIVQTMHERKKMMAERADAFLALPGGIGTFEELFEVWTWRQLGYHDKPLGLLNTGGYYDGLLAFMQHTMQEGFVSSSQVELLQVDDTADALLARLAAAAAAATGPDDYERI